MSHVINFQMPEKKIIPCKYDFWRCLSKMVIYTLKFLYHFVIYIHSPIKGKFPELIKMQNISVSSLFLSIPPVDIWDKVC